MTYLSFYWNATADFFAHIYNYGTDTVNHKYAQSGQPIDCIFLEGDGNYVLYVCDSPRRKMLTVVNNSNYAKRVLVTYQSSATVTIQPWNFLIFITAEINTSVSNSNRVVNLHVMQQL